VSRRPEAGTDRAARRRLIALLLRRGDIGADLLRESRFTTLAADAGVTDTGAATGGEPAAAGADAGEALG
jgi:hypothetical protein